MKDVCHIPRRDVLDHARLLAERATQQENCLAEQIGGKIALGIECRVVLSALAVVLRKSANEACFLLFSASILEDE